MTTFNEHNLWVNNRLTRLYQLYPRRYTLTHSDQTGELFLTIGSEFAYEKLTTKRDEVLGEWLSNKSGKPYLYIYIRLDGIDGTVSTVKRNKIFLRELPLALKAIKKGDEPFFQFYPQFLQAPIYVFFQSQNPQLNRTECLGRFNDY